VAIRAGDDAARRMVDREFSDVPVGRDRPDSGGSVLREPHAPGAGGDKEWLAAGRHRELPDDLRREARGGSQKEDGGEAANGAVSPPLGRGAGRRLIDPALASHVASHSGLTGPGRSLRWRNWRGEVLRAAYAITRVSPVPCD